ncbi:hypothetical protein J6590_093327 [Homalodisca vitripennis]|nr:hypothetical protein J6590_093327 [Homalodisca vitripennis]
MFQQNNLQARYKRLMDTGLPGTRARLLLFHHVHPMTADCPSTRHSVTYSTNISSCLPIPVHVRVARSIIVELCLIPATRYTSSTYITIDIPLYTIGALCIV